MHPRVAELIRTMTLPEKLGQLTMITADMAITGPGLNPDYLASVRAGEVGSLLNIWGAERVHEAQRIAVEETRLGIPLFVGFDVIHGHKTIFPIPLAEAAAFDPGLWERTARAAAVEATADGLSLTFAPMLDVPRDPRWGRIAESAGEDPWLTARFGEAKVRGFQGTDLAAAHSLATTTKHFCAYGAATAGREYAPVDVSERQVEEVYLPPFEAAVRAGGIGIMPGFNDLAGVPMTAHVRLLRERLRERWGFEGVVITDYTAIPELLNHGVGADIADVAALALKAGVDVDMVAQAFIQGLPTALERGAVTMADIDAAVARVLAFKVRLGLFDDPYRRGAVGGIAATQRAEHRALAREAARRCAVLLQDRPQLLPIARAPRRVAVVGPLGDDGAAMIGTWGAAGLPAESVTFYQGLQNRWPTSEIGFAAGVPLEGDGPADIDGACDLAAAADLVVLCLGENGLMSGEGASRGRPGLPGRQAELARAILALGRPTVVLLTAGRPLIEPWLFETAGTIVATLALGSEAGNGVADLLSGDADFTGRLPFTWPVDVGQIPIFFSQRPTGRPADPGNRYSARYIDLPVEPLFPFGHGLAYAAIELANVRVDRQTLSDGEVLTVEVEATNPSARPGESAILLFTRDPVASVARPLLELKGMTRIALEPGETRTVAMTLQAADLAFPGLDLEPVVEPGEVRVLVGPTADPASLLPVTVTVVAGPASV